MKKSRISTLLLFCALLAGLSLLLYPTLSDYWNSLHQSRAITQYAQEVTDMNAQRYAAMLADRCAAGADLGLSPDLLTKLWTLIHEESVRRQLQILSH